MEMNIRLESTTNLYEQIYAYIRDEIRSGSLTRGERIPSSRALAGQLGLSRTTVQLAYDQLLAEGYIETRHGSGSYVCGLENMTDLSSTHAAQALPPATATAPSENTEGLLDFSPRDIDMTQFPYPTWRRIMRELMTGDRSDIFTRGDAQGDADLREIIAHYLHLSRGCRCAADQIVIGAGTDYLLLLLTFILGPGRTVAIENPGYSRAYRILQAAGYSPTSAAMDQYGMRAPADDASLAYVMPARQYPTGIAMPYTRRAELLRWANAAPERYLIEDDYDSLFRYQGKPAPSLQSEDRSGRVIYIGTFSKSIAPAIRVSYMILPQGLLAAYHERASLFASTVPRIDQAILAEFIHGGYYERYLNRMRKHYKVKHDCLTTQLRSLPDPYTVTGIGAGLHLILHSGKKVADPIEEEERVAALARDAGVIIHPMSHLLLPNIPLSTNYQPSWLLGYAALTNEEIVEGTETLISVLT